jgi:lipopolysaccharide biosynthesis glycosyltransferase
MDEKKNKIYDKPVRVYVGWDSREDIAYQVCKYSIEKRSNLAQVIPLKRQELIDAGMYDRPKDTLGSTEFTFTRFLVPKLEKYQGWAIFCDCDILWQIGVEELLPYMDDRYAVVVVKHDYKPTNKIKMDGKEQHLYPRKNWSSVILWNSGHPSNRCLTKDVIDTATGEYLHRFRWLDDEEIGEISCEYNWLVNWYKQPDNGIPKIIHYTEGGPWFNEYMHCEYGALWEREKNEYLHSIQKVETQEIVYPYLNLSNEITKVFDNILKYRVDPLGEYYDMNYSEVIRSIRMLDNKKVYAVEGEKNPPDIKGNVYDPFLRSFILGSGGQLTNYDKVAKSTVPVVFRGITKSKHMRACLETGRTFYYIDTGYFGNGRKKLYHRITKNAMQNVGPIINRPRDRLAATGYQPRKFRTGRNILVCPPSAKAMECFGLNLQEWITAVVKEIQKYTDRPIIIREKASRRERTAVDTIEMALERDVHCLVTYNSIAATEAVLLGKPAFTLGPNAAHSVSSNDLAQLENPYIPTLDEVEEWAAHLAYAQFTEAEMTDGTAWRILTENE